MTRLPPWRAIAALSALAVAVATIPGVAVTNASWVDVENDYASVAALQCVGATSLDSRATGRFLSGALLNSSINPVVGVTGVTVTNQGSGATAVAGTPGATYLLANNFDAPLSASAINSAIQLGTSVTLPINWANTATGVYTQYGQALGSGRSTGASGVVTNMGAVDVTRINGGTAPTVGRVSLSGLPYVGAPLSGIADLNLEVGAVAASATLDGCSYAWAGGTPTSSQLARDYYVSQLRANLTSDALRALFGPSGVVPTATQVVQTQVDTLLGTAATPTGTAESGIASSALGGLTGALQTVVNSTVLLSLGTGNTSSTTITLDLAPTVALLTETKSTGGVSVNLGTGTVTIDAATLLGSLNGQPANTAVLTPTQLNAVLGRVDTIVGNQIALVNTALTAALNTATVNVQVHVNLSLAGANVIGVDLGYTGTLAGMALGQATTVGPTVSLLVLPTTVLNGLLSTVVSGLTPLLGGILSTVTGAVTAQANNPIGLNVNAFLATAAAQRTASINALGGALTALGSILSVTLNAQPDQAPFPASPYAPKAGASALTDEFFVSALRIGVLDRTGGGAASLVNLFLASASVGPSVQ